LVVSNSSPLVYLAALGDFDLFRRLFGEIAIPNAVFEEVVVGGTGHPVARLVQAATASWLLVRSIADTNEAEELCQAGLHRGESEAIVFAAELNSGALLMDDSDGIRFAKRAGINVTRTAGVYRLAKQRGLVEAIRPKIDALRREGFWLSDEHYRIILESAGE
jgi:hypothetical protein